MARRKRRAKRAPESYISKDLERRQAQLANLQTAGPPVSPGRPRVHGGYARVAAERLDVKVAEVIAALAEDAPLRDPDGRLPVADTVAVTMLATCLCRLEGVSAHVRDFGALDQTTGEVRPVVDLEARLRREVADWLDALGMTPRSRKKLELDVLRAHRATLADFIDGTET